MSDQHPVVRFPQPIDLAKRAMILNLEREIAKLPQVDLVVKHYFADGMYHREIHIPVGVVLVGYIHMQACITVVSQGRILIADGGETRVIVAPFTMACAPGSKKAGYALEDTIWADTYLNLDNCTDIDKLMARLVAVTSEEFERRFHGPALSNN